MPPRFVELTNLTWPDLRRVIVAFSVFFFFCENWKVERDDAVPLERALERGETWASWNRDLLPNCVKRRQITCSTTDGEFKKECDFLVSKFAVVGLAVVKTTSELKKKGMRGLFFRINLYKSKFYFLKKIIW